jgi:soluble cytochrome b562
MWSASFSDKKMGLQRAKNAVYGLLLVLTSYIILRTIDPRLVEIPNTLVPQLTINPSLLKDVNLQMIRELEDQVNKYRLREVDIENELRQLGEDKTKKRAEILAIEKEIEQLQTETPDASEKFNQLNVQKAKILEEIRKLEVEFQKKITKSAINQTVVSNLQDLAEINPDFQVGVQEKLAGANKKKSDITDYENSGKKLLGINGEFDNSYIQEQGTFGKSIIDLDSLDLLIKSSMVVNEGSVYMGSGGSLKVKLIKPNGEIESYRSVTEAKEVLKKELDRIKGNAALLTDKEILGRLDARIKEVQANLDSNPTLNGKIF